MQIPKIDWQAVGGVLAGLLTLVGVLFKDRVMSLFEKSPKRQSTHLSRTEFNEIMTTLTARIESIEEAATEASINARSASDALKAIGDMIEASMNNLGDRFDKAIDKLDVSVDKIVTKLDSHESRISKAETSLEERVGIVERIQNRLDSLRGNSSG